MASSVYRTSDGDIVDAIVWKFYGTQSGLIVEQVMLANPGLAEVGPVLPAGLEITLPEITVTEETTVVRLWD